MPYFSTPSTYETHKDVLVSGNSVIATYTVDADYVAAQTLADGSSRKVLWEGTVMSRIGTTGLIVPNYTTYGFAPLGVLLQTVDVNDGDEIAPVVFRGDVAEDYCYDNGIDGTVLAATKNALAGRITFNTVNRL